MTLRFSTAICLALGLLACNQSHAQIFRPGQPIPERHSLPICPKAGDRTLECYSKPDFTISEAAKRLGASSLTYWIINSDLFIAARGSKPQLCCTFNDDMLPVGEDGISPIWGLRLHLPHIRDTRLELGLVNMVDGRAVLTRGIPCAGPDAPALAEKSQPLKGRLETIEIDSPNLGEQRKITIYTPRAPQPPGGYPVVYMADGQDTDGAAAVVEALIENRLIRPVMLVGIWHGDGPFTATYPFDKRGKEYLPGLNADPQSYARHEMFVKDEVIPLVEASYPVSKDRKDRLIYGTSNGAAWALSFAARHPDLFAQASGFGVATPADTIEFSRSENTKIFVGAGHYDDFSGNSKNICDKALSEQLSCTYYSIYSGHDQAMWDYGLVQTLEAVFKPVS